MIQQGLPLEAIAATSHYPAGKANDPPFLLFPLGGFKHSSTSHAWTYAFSAPCLNMSKQQGGEHYLFSLLGCGVLVEPATLQKNHHQDHHLSLPCCRAIHDE